MPNSGLEVSSQRLDGEGASNRNVSVTAVAELDLLRVNRRVAFEELEDRLEVVGRRNTRKAFGQCVLVAVASGADSEGSGGGIFGCSMAGARRPPSGLDLSLPMILGVLAWALRRR